MSKTVSLASQLSVWDFVNEYLGFSDHSFSAGFKLQGIDISCMDMQEINLVVESLEKMLTALDPGVRLQIFYKLQPKVSENINEHIKISKDSLENIQEVAKSRQNFLLKLADKRTFFKPEIYFFVRSKKVKIKGLKLFQKEQKWKAWNEEELSKSLGLFEKTVNTVQSSLRVGGFEPKILNSNEWFQIMFQYLNPGRSEKNGETALNKTTSVLSSSLSEQLCLTDLSIFPNEVRLGKVKSRIISLKTLPEQETFASMIYHLMKLPFAFEISQSILIPDQKVELDKLAVHRRLANSMAAGAKNVRDIESEAQLHDLESLTESLIAGSEKIIFSDLNVIIRSESEDELDEMADEVLKAFRQMNSSEGVLETLPSFEAYMKALPGRCETFRSRKMKTSNAASFMPVFASWEGNRRPVALLPNREGVLVRIDPFADELPNWNGIVFGGSGSGKSFTVANLILSFIGQKPTPKVIWIDNGASSQKLVESLSGEFINLSLDTGIRLNVFDLDQMSSPTPSKIKLILAVLETILKDDEKPSLPKREIALLEEAIYKTYETFQDRTPTLTDFRDLLKNHPVVEMRNFAQILFSWTGETAYGRLLDGPSNITLSKNLTTVEISGLNSHPSLQNVFLLLLTDFIRSEAAKDLSSPYLLIIDEAWRVFQSSESGKSFALECYRLMRKFFSGIYCLSQNYRDFLSDPDVAEAILPNTTHVFILRQKKIDWDDFQKTLGLKDAEIEAIKSLEIKKGEYSEVFYMQDEKRSLLRIRPDPLSYLICTSDGKDRGMIEEAKLKYPELEPLQLLKKIIAVET